MPSTYTKLLIHMVFSTKNRERTLTPEIRVRLFPYLGGLAGGKEMTAIQVGGIEDHIHILLSIPTPITIAEAAKTLKGASSKWLHETFGRSEFTAWQEGYGAFTIGASQVERTRTYIERQEEHHKQETFKDEFLRFLEVNVVEYDPRYIWD